MERPIIDTRIHKSMPGGDKHMSQKKRLGILLWIGAVVALAGGAAALLLGHMKTGYGLTALGVIVVVVGLVTFFSRSSVKVELPDREWM